MWRNHPGQSWTLTRGHTGNVLHNVNGGFPLTAFVASAIPIETPANRSVTDTGPETRSIRAVFFFFLQGCCDRRRWYLRGTATPHMHGPRGQQLRVRAGAREGRARQRTRRKLLPAPPRHADSSCPVLRFRVVQVNTQAVNESLRRQECVSRSWVDDGLHTPLDSSVAHENSDEHLAETVQWHVVLSSASVFLATAAPASWRFDRLVDRQRSSLTTVSCRLGMTKSITEIKNNRFQPDFLGHLGRMWPTSLQR